MARSLVKRDLCPRGVLLAGSLAFAVSLVLQLSIWPVFEIQRRAVRSEMKWKLLRGVPESDLLIYRFSREVYAELEFEDGGKEVELKGIMHDIVRTLHEADGTVVIHVVRDDVETALLAGLDQRVRGIQERDTRGQEQRRALTALWAAYHESPGTRLLSMAPMDRWFHEPLARHGRTIDSADPGPPRGA